MNNDNSIVIFNQSFGSNTFDNTCFCQLKNTYNTFFKANESAKCVGQPNMQCLIYSIEGTGVVIYKSQKSVKLIESSVFFGSMKDMSVIKCQSNNWHFLCYWYFIENAKEKYDGMYFSDRIDYKKEEEDALQIISLMQSGSYSKLSIASSLFTVKLLELANLLNLHKETNNLLLDKILAYINLHIKERITTKDIAVEFGYCEKHIRYIFNRHLNTSPNKFIDGLKLEHIMLMLQTTSYSLEDLAEIFNYSSASHLICNFKKIYKCTPKQYISRMKIRQEYSKIN